MEITFIVFIFVLVAQCSNIANNCRCGWKTTRTLTIKKLLVGETTFNHYTIVFVPHK